MRYACFLVGLFEEAEQGELAIVIRFFAIGLIFRIVELIFGWRAMEVWSFIGFILILLVFIILLLVI